MNDTSAAINLSKIYSDPESEYYDIDLSDFYMDKYYEKHKELSFFNKEVATYYYERILDTENMTHILKFYRLLGESYEPSQITDWYFYAYRKYITGDIDRAYLAFAFGSELNHVESTKAAGYIWEHNLLHNITCKLGSPLHCAAYFYLKAASKNDIDGAYKYANVVHKIGQEDKGLRNVTDQIEYGIYSAFAPDSLKLAYYQAIATYYGTGVEEDRQKANEMLNWIITNNHKFNDGWKAYMPVFLTKSYFLFRGIMESINNFLPFEVPIFFSTFL